MGEESGSGGVVDVVRRRPHLSAPAIKGRARGEEIAAELADTAREWHEKLVEMVAEGDDALMEEFFEKGTIGDEHLVGGLKKIRLRLRSAGGRGRRGCALLLGGERRSEKQGEERQAGKSSRHSPGRIAGWGGRRRTFKG